MMTSCFTYTAVVGKGSQTGVEVKGKNHFLIQGLAPLSVSNAKQMAGGASDYDLTVTHTFNWCNYFWHLYANNNHC